MVTRDLSPGPGNVAGTSASRPPNAREPRRVAQLFRPLQEIRHKIFSPDAHLSLCCWYQTELATGTNPPCGRERFRSFATASKR